MFPLELPVGRLSLADVWTALPPGRRQPALDYWQQGEPYARIRNGFHLVGCLRGHRDWYTVEVRPDHGVYVGACTCGRRAVCAHVGALLLAWAEDPDGFRLWETLRPALSDPAWDWVRAVPFPWDRVAHDDGPWTRPPLDSQAADGVLRALEQVTPAHFPRRLEACHPDWWTVSVFTARIQSLVRAMADTPLPRSVLVAWADAAGSLPAGLLSPLWASPRADDPAVEAHLLSHLYEAVGHLFDASAATETRAQRLVAHTADWYAARGRWVDADGLLSRLGPLVDPYGLAAAEWLYRHGRLEQARRLLRHKPEPPDNRRRQARRALLQLVSEAGAEPDPASE